MYVVIDDGITILQVLSFGDTVGRDEEVNIVI